LQVSGSAATRPLILLDACCLLNLYATGRIEEIVRSIRAQFGIVAVVATEALYVYRGGGGQDAQQRVPVDTSPLVAAGLLDILRPETELEHLSFVAFAAVLDDGEAMTAALAIHRGAAVATDDRKALRELRAQAPQVTLWSTASLIKQWAENCHITRSELGAALRDIRARSRFQPGAHDPLSGWWQASATPGENAN
jgi:predicted nucleic acid-binding protein